MMTTVQMSIDASKASGSYSCKKCIYCGIKIKHITPKVWTKYKVGCGDCHDTNKRKSKRAKDQSKV